MKGSHILKFFWLIVSLFVVALFLTGAALAQEEVVHDPPKVLYPVPPEFGSPCEDDLGCTAHLMWYIPSDRWEPCEPNFDCEDFAWVVDEYCDSIGLVAHQIFVWGDFDGNGEAWGHTFNIVETGPVDYFGEPMVEYRFYDAVLPMPNTTSNDPENQPQAIVRWYVPAGERPSIPIEAWVDWLAQYGWNYDDVEGVAIWDEGHLTHQYPDADGGEPPFIANPNYCNLFEALTGLCVPEPPEWFNPSQPAPNPDNEGAVLIQDPESLVPPPPEPAPEGESPGLPEQETTEDESTEVPGEEEPMQIYPPPTPGT